MAESSRRVRSAVSAAVIAALAGLAAGCGGGEGVQSYRVPKSTEKDRRPPPPDEPGAGEYRILGAMCPADDPTWFVKLTGPADRVARREAEFDKLAASVKLGAEPAAVPTFTLPGDDWKPAGPRSIHAQTIRVDGMEVTITASRGGAASNAERWAGQVGYRDARDLKKYTREFQADGVRGLRVDVSGPKNPSAGGMPPMFGGR